MHTILNCKYKREREREREREHLGKEIKKTLCYTDE